MRLLSFLFAFLAIANAIDPLYDSSNPDLKWPPSPTALQGPPPTWPGDGQRLGKLWPRIKVPVRTEQPTAPDFFAQYVHTRKPVVFDNLLTSMTARSGQSLKSKDLLYEARAALSDIDVEYGAGDKAGQKENMPLTQFLKSTNVENKIYTHDHIPKVLKTQIAMPEFLKCADVKGMLAETRHIFFSYPNAFPMRQENRHRLFCQIEGTKEVLLVDPKDFIGLGEMKSTKGPKQRTADFDPAAVNFKDNPELAKIKKFYIAELTEGQCLYVPEGWLHQHTVLDGDHSIAIRWERSDLEHDLPCDKHISSILTLGDTPWLDEGVEQPKEKTTDRERKEDDMATYVINKYIMKSTESEIDLAAFYEVLKKDGKLLEQLVEWESECEEFGQKLFKHLDRNEDGNLSKADMADVAQEKDLRHWIGVLDDRCSDLMEIAWDQRVDKAGPPNMDPMDLHEYVQNMEEYEIKAMIERREEKKENKDSKKDEL